MILNDTPQRLAPRTGTSEPKSPARARRLAGLKQNLGEPVIVAEDMTNLEFWSFGPYFQFKPQNPWQAWITQMIGLLMVRLNRVERIERRLRDYASYRAIEFWADDQALAAAHLAKKIGDDPLETVHQLKATVAGCDWLIASWRTVVDIPVAQWTEAQRALVVNLMMGRWLVQGDANPAAWQIEHLEAQRAAVAESDQILRTLIEADLSEDLSPALTRLRRYEKTLNTRLKWYVAEARQELPDRADRPVFAPASITPQIEPTVVEPILDAPTATDATNPTDLPSPGDTPNSSTTATSERDETNPSASSDPATEAATHPATAADQTKPTTLADPEPLVEQEVKADEPLPTERKARPNLTQLDRFIRMQKRRSAAPRTGTPLPQQATG